MVYVAAGLREEKLYAPLDEVVVEETGLPPFERATVTPERGAFVTEFVMMPEREPLSGASVMFAVTEPSDVAVAPADPVW